VQSLLRAALVQQPLGEEGGVAVGIMVEAVPDGGLHRLHH